MIMLWSGSIVSIPSGWALCDGNNGTPDLRNRFVVGAGSTYAVDATGGSADATLVSHDHPASSSTSISDPGHFHYTRSYSTGVEVLGQGTATSVNFENRVQVNTSADPTTTRTTASASTGISASTSTSITQVGSSGTNANLPPYFALAYIMKL
jgi:microcystin-dependent protein